MNKVWFDEPIFKQFYTRNNLRKRLMRKAMLKNESNGFAKIKFKKIFIIIN